MNNWNYAKRLQTKSGYLNYLKNYPSGTYKRIAEEKILNCLAITREENICKTVTKYERECTDDWDYQDIEATKNVNFYGRALSVAHAEEICESQAGNNIGSELNRRCRRGEIEDIDYTCNCNGFTSTCLITAEASCVVEEEVCERVPYDEEVCNTETVVTGEEHCP